MQGSCLCGAVTYRIEGPVGRPFYCHCSRCRKASGSAFATNFAVPSTGFRFVCGEADVRVFTAPSGLQRLFCGGCGSPLLSRRGSDADVVRVRAGTLDSPLPVPPQAHAFVDSRAAWHELAEDGLPRHAARLPAEFSTDFPCRA